jgi:acyl dehydratase
MNVLPFTSLPDLVGRELGVSEWLTIDQARIDAFADVTGDHQWIHVDPVRAAVGPFGCTVAHGYLTLSLIPALLATAYGVNGVKQRINYGLDRVRFPAPVKVDSDVRARAVLTALENVAGGADLSISVTVEVRDERRPACVAATRSRFLV